MATPAPATPATAPPRHAGQRAHAHAIAAIRAAPAGAVQERAAAEYVTAAVQHLPPQGSFQRAVAYTIHTAILGTTYTPEDIAAYLVCTHRLAAHRPATR